MKRPAPAGRRLRRLRLSLAVVWAVAFGLGLALIAGVAVRLNSEVHARDLDAELALVAMATYGLTYFDQQGRFHDELFQREPDIAQAPYDIWVIEPAGKVFLQPPRSRFSVDFTRLAEQVVGSQAEVTCDVFGSGRRRLRLHAIPAFPDRGDAAIAAIVVIGDPQPGILAHRDFVRGLLGSVLALAAAGIALAWSLAA